MWCVCVCVLQNSNITVALIQFNDFIDYVAALGGISMQTQTYHTLLVLVWSVTIRDPLYSSSSSGAIQRSGIHSLSGVR